jgi:hypothetical protein
MDNPQGNTNNSSAPQSWLAGLLGYRLDLHNGFLPS